MKLMHMLGKTPVAKETQPASDRRHGNLYPKSVKGSLRWGDVPLLKISLLRLCVFIRVCTLPYENKLLVTSSKWMED